MISHTENPFEVGSTISPRFIGGRKSAQSPTSILDHHVNRCGDDRGCSMWHLSKHLPREADTVNGRSRCLLQRDRARQQLARPDERWRRPSFITHHDLRREDRNRWFLRRKGNDVGHVEARRPEGWNWLFRQRWGCGLRHPPERDLSLSAASSRVSPERLLLVPCHR